MNLATTSAKRLFSTHCDANVYNSITTNQTIGGAIRVGVPGLIDKVENTLHKKRLRKKKSTVGKPGKNTCEEIPFIMSQEGPEQRVLARLSGWKTVSTASQSWGRKEYSPLSQRSCKVTGLDAERIPESRGISMSILSKVLKPLMKMRFNHKKSERLIVPAVSSRDTCFHSGRNKFRSSAFSAKNINTLTR